jgi:putative ABC transport system permease protein
MYTRDVLTLAFVALWQRKMRTTLTIVGVAIGSFVLITSLAISEGVQEVLLGQLRRQDQLRRILVWPGGGPPEKVPAKELEIPGEMSSVRRERLREAIQRRRQAPARKPASAGITRSQVKTLTELAHVETVSPSFTWTGTIEVLGKSLPVLVRNASPDDPGMNRRLVTGRPFVSDERALYVSEYVLYKSGIVDEKDVKSSINDDARLILTVTQPNIGNLLFLLNVSRPTLTPKEQAVLTKLLERLPRALNSLEMSDEERKVLAELLRESRPENTRSVERKLPIVGVIRDVARAELGPWDGPPRPVDVILSPELAKEMFFAVPGRAQAGYPQVSVRVEEERHIREAEAKIKELGMETFSFADLVDQVRLNVLLIAIACTLVAIIALLVAALGITNTMLMSVLERTHEIGVMKATGARNGHVQALFIMEGTLVGILGAALGLLASWLMSFPGDQFAKHLVASRTPMALEESVFLFPAWLVFAVPLGVCVLTTLAALYPARRAARVDPIEALRQH